MWPALCMEGVQLFVCDVFNTAQGTKNLENVKECIKKYPDAQKHLFGINSSASPKPIDINKMFFLLIAAEMIEVAYEHNLENKTALDMLLDGSKSSDRFIHFLSLSPLDRRRLYSVCAKCIALFVNIMCGECVDHPFSVVNFI